MVRSILAVTSAVVVGIAIMTAPHDVSAQDGKPASGRDGVFALSAAYNSSGLALFRQLSRARGNIVLSPFSIGTAMAMVLSGARGDTAREMAGVLKQHLDRGTIEAANAAVRSLIAGYDKSAAPSSCPSGMQALGGHCETPLPSNGKCKFPSTRDGERCVAPGQPPPSAMVMTANALMLTKVGQLISTDYAALLRNQCGAELFQNATLDVVNDWVKRRTQGKIERILDNLDPSSAAVLLNAVYFKAKWASVFNKGMTADDAFNLSARQKNSVPMMRQSNRFALVSRPGYRAIRLPYAVRAIGMIIVLPDEIDGLDAVAGRMDADQWMRLVADLGSSDSLQSVALALPRFKASFAADLVPLFRAQGMVRAFDFKWADFSGMTARSPLQAPFAIGSIRHRAVIDVTEDGTEAAATTAVDVVAGGYPEALEPFRVDRPFLFAIVDEVSGAMLFNGRIVDPRL
jgi:serpin B